MGSHQPHRALVQLEAANGLFLKSQLLSSHFDLHTCKVSELRLARLWCSRCQNPFTETQTYRHKCWKRPLWQLCHSRSLHHHMLVDRRGRNPARPITHTQKWEVTLHMQQHDSVLFTNRAAVEQCSLPIGQSVTTTQNLSCCSPRRRWWI